LQPQPDGSKPKQLVILTRWHPDDIAGRLMATEDWKEGRWKHINFQAIEKTKAYRKARKDLPEDDPRYLPPEVFAKTSSTQRDTWTYKEHSLWPERFPLEDLKRRQRLNPREFAALYQQEPYIQGGNLIKTEWWGNYPKDLSPENFVTLVIAVDTAFKKTEQSDYSVACVAGLDRNGDIYIVDIIRGKYDFPELKQRLIRLNNAWRGRGLRAMYIEDKASGQSLIQELKRESGMAIVPYKVVADKVARVNAVLPIIEGGRVFVPEESPWLDDFIEETVTFPNGMHDDQVDAAIMAIDILSRTSVSPEQYALQADPMQSLNNQKADFGKSLFKNVAGKARNWKGWGL
jgi:predicted phage terminase large subunit-like protein